MFLVFIFGLGRDGTNVPHVGYPVRLGYGAEEVVVGVVLGTTVMGMEVTNVEP